MQLLLLIILKPLWVCIHTIFFFECFFLRLSSFSQQRELMCTFKPWSTVCVLDSSALNIPNPVSRGRWDIDCQRPAAFLNLHSEQQRRVGHLLHLLLDELRLCGLLEVLGLGYFVHEAHYLARPMATHKAAMWGMRGLSFIQNNVCIVHCRSLCDWCVMTKEILLPLLLTPRFQQERPCHWGVPEDLLHLMSQH